MPSPRFFILAVTLLMLASPGCNEYKVRPVILISLDTLRQDHLGCYGYGRDTSPNLDRFARNDAVLFESAYAQAPYTLPSHMSILTGLYPDTHGILLPFLVKGLTQIACLAEGVTTIAETLKREDYTTAAFTDGLFVSKKYGFDQGFDLYKDERSPEWEKNGFRKYRKALYDWIDRHCDKNFFLFIHTYDTHAPYVPPEPFRSKFRDEPPAREIPQGSLLYCSLLGIHNSHRLHQYNTLQDVVDRYDGAIAFVDHEMGRLFEFLKEKGIWEEAIVVVTTDHGESFMENSLIIGHGLCPSNEEVLIPLLVKLPRSLYGGQRVDHVVESIDIMPTILDALELACPRDVQGQSLLRGVREGQWTKGFAYGITPNAGNSRYLIQDGIKYIEAVNDPKDFCLKGNLRPINPPHQKKPEKSYYVWDKKPYFYSFEEDPLGIRELFQRGDRAYDLSTTKFEWKAPEITNPDLLKRYKKAVVMMAAKRTQEGRKFIEEGVQGGSLTDKEIEQLNALGYGGIIATHSLGSDVNKTGPDLASSLDPSVPLSDRTLLNQGDEILWKLSRDNEKQKDRISAEDFNEMVGKARSYYEKFRKLYPRKKSWVEWRIRYVSALAKKKK